MSLFPSADIGLRLREWTSDIEAFVELAGGVLERHSFAIDEWFWREHWSLLLQVFCERRRGGTFSDENMEYLLSIHMHGLKQVIVTPFELK